MTKAHLVTGLILSLGFSISWNPSLSSSASRQTLSFASRAVAAQPEKLIDLKAVLSKAKTTAGSTFIADSEIKEETPAETTLDQSAGTQSGQNPAKQKETIIPKGKVSDLQSFDLEKIDPSQKGLKVFYELDESGSERRVRYYVEGVNPDTCTDCLELGKAFSEPLKDQNVKNIEMLNRMIAEMALSKIQKKKEDVKKISTQKKEKLEVTSACEDSSASEFSQSDKELLQMGLDNSEETETRMNCKLEEFQALAQECQEILEVSTSGMSKDELKTSLSDRKACSQKVALYYSKFIKKDLAQGLSSKASSQENAISAAARDNFLRAIPAQLSGIKKDILKVSQAGVLDRGQAFYNSQLANKGPQESVESIASKARYKMLMDLHGAEGAALCSAFSGESAEACQAANTSPALRASLASQSSGYKFFNESYLSPMEKFSTASGALGFDSLIAQTGVNTGSGVPAASLPQVDPNLNPKMPVPEGVLNARTGALNRGNGSGILLPVPGSQQLQPSQGGTTVPFNSVAPAVPAAKPAPAYPQTTGQLKPGSVPLMNFQNKAPTPTGVQTQVIRPATPGPINR